MKKSNRELEKTVEDYQVFLEGIREALEKIGVSLQEEIYKISLKFSGIGLEGLSSVASELDGVKASLTVLDESEESNEVLEEAVEEPAKDVEESE